MKTAILLGGDASTISGYRDDELKLAQVPNYVLWVEGDPRCFNSETFAMFDRCNNNWIQTYNSTIESKVENKIIVNQNPSTATPYDLEANINDSWTLVLVGTIPIEKASLMTLAPRSNTDTDFPLRVGCNAEKRVTMWGGTTAVIRISANSEAITNALQVDKPFLLTFTFSTEKGLSLWVNGSKVAENKDDKNKLTSNQFTFATNRNFNLGHMLIYNDDLTKNIANIRLVHDALLKYYEIPRL